MVRNSVTLLFLLSVIVIVGFSVAHAANLPIPQNDPRCAQLCNGKPECKPKKYLNEGKPCGNNTGECNDRGQCGLKSPTSLPQQPEPEIKKLFESLFKPPENSVNPPTLPPGTEKPEDNITWLDYYSSFPKKEDELKQPSLSPTPLIHPDIPLTSPGTQRPPTLPSFFSDTPNIYLIAPAYPRPEVPSPIADNANPGPGVALTPVPRPENAPFLPTSLFSPSPPPPQNPANPLEMQPSAPNSPYTGFVQRNIDPTPEEISAAGWQILYRLYNSSLGRVFGPIPTNR